MGAFFLMVLVAIAAVLLLLEMYEFRQVKKVGNDQLLRDLKDVLNYRVPKRVLRQLRRHESRIVVYFSEGDRVECLSLSEFCDLQYARFRYLEGPSSILVHVHSQTGPDTGHEEYVLVSRAGWKLADYCEYIWDPSGQKQAIDQTQSWEGDVVRMASCFCLWEYRCKSSIRLVTDSLRATKADTPSKSIALIAGATAQFADDKYWLSRHRPSIDSSS